VFLGLGSIIALSANYFGQSGGNPIMGLVRLFICFVVASMVYNMIKGDAPEVEVKEKQSINEEISKKLEEEEIKYLISLGEFLGMK